MTRVSVIIPHYEDLANLACRLEDVAAQVGDGVEVIVADSASPSGLTAVRAVAAGRAQVVIAAVRGAGAARARRAMPAWPQLRGRSLPSPTPIACRARADWRRGLPGWPGPIWLAGRFSSPSPTIAT